jgi:hypothetical protein
MKYISQNQRCHGSKQLYPKDRKTIVFQDLDTLSTNTQVIMKLISHFLLKAHVLYDN